MSALGDISAALGPAAQGIGQGLAGGAQLQAQYGQQQQRINTDAAAQRAQAQYQAGVLAQAHEEADRRDYGSQLDLLANPKTVGDLSVTPAGKARLLQARDAVNGYAQKYGWASLPPDVDVTHPVAGPQAAATAAVTNALQPDTAPTSPSSGSGADLSLPSMANPWDRNHAATVLAVHEGLDKAHLVNVGRAMQAELEGHLGNPQAATWLGPTYDQALTLRNKLATMLNNPKTSAADLRALIGQHPQAAEEHSQAVGGRPFAQTAALALPPELQLPSAQLPAGVAGPQPPPGSIRTAGGTQIPATLAPGVAGPQPPPGAYRDATGTVMPPAAAPSSPAASSVLAPLLAGMGLSSSPSPTSAPAPPPTAPAAPTVPGMPGAVAAFSQIPGLPPLPPAASAALNFDPDALRTQLEAQFPNMLPEQREQLIASRLNNLQQNLTTQDAAVMYPYRVLQAGLAARLTSAQIAEQLSLAGYHTDQTAIEKARLQIQQQEANTGRMNAQTEQTKAQVQAGQFGVTTGLAQQRITNEQQNQELNAYQRAASVTNQEQRQQLMAMRAELPRLQMDAQRATDKYITSTNARGGLSIGVPGSGLGISGGGGVTVSKQEGYTYAPGPATTAYQQALQQVNKLAQQPGAFIGRDYREFQLLTRQINQVDLTLVKQATNQGVKAPDGQLHGFVDVVNELASADPAQALRMVRAFRTLYPKKALPPGLDLSPIAGGGGATASPTATAPAAAPLTAPANQPPPNPVHALLDSILNPYPRGSQDVTKPNPTPSLGEFALGGMP